MLVDGSPAYLATHTTRGKKKRATRTQTTDEADALAYFVQLFKELDPAKVSLVVHRFERFDDIDIRKDSL